MKRRKYGLKLFMGVLFVILVLCANFQYVCAKDDRKVDITIKGVIANLEKAKEYITEDSYLQLVFLPSEGTIRVDCDVEGLMTYISELPRIDMPSDSIFTFKIASLKPGQYIIVIQRVPSMFLFGGAYLKGGIVEIPEKLVEPITIDLGEVLFPVPHGSSNETPLVDE